MSSNYIMFIGNSRELDKVILFIYYKNKMFIFFLFTKFYYKCIDLIEKY